MHGIGGSGLAPLEVRSGNSADDGMRLLPPINLYVERHHERPAGLRAPSASKAYGRMGLSFNDSKIQQVPEMLLIELCRNSRKFRRRRLYVAVHFGLLNRDYLGRNSFAFVCRNELKLLNLISHNCPLE